MSQTLQQPQASPKGFRLSFHRQLIAPIDVTEFPFHYAAVTGNHKLALFLYAKGLSHEGKLFSLACFSAEGLTGDTPWRHPLQVSPSQAALLAGDTTAAHILSLIEKDVPLHWTQANHCKFPAEFRQQVAAMVSAIACHPTILRLPALVRQQIINEVAISSSRKDVWQIEDPQVWDDQWSEFLGLDLYEHGLKLLPSQQEESSQEEEEEQQGGQQDQQQQQQQQQPEYLPLCYQLRLNAQPRRRPSFLKACIQHAAVMGVSWIMLEATVLAVHLARQQMTKKK
ncbi:hypothetical protein WJX74_001755 [Apatococcus lobatus]|uniref:Uncharacterized protein n=1 Tax=Apatococcus lobatus TaxID=904363 RepID=A0AAW1QGX6_9CHLO